MNSNQTLRLQLYLKSKGYINEKPSADWSPNKISGYKNFIIENHHGWSKEIPSRVDQLPKEVRDFVALQDLVHIGSEETQDSKSTDSEDQSVSGDQRSDTSVSDNSEDNSISTSDSTDSGEDEDDESDSDESEDYTTLRLLN